MKLLYNISLNRSWQTLNFVIKFVLQPKFGKLGIFKSSQIMLHREEAQESALLISKETQPNYNFSRLQMFCLYHRIYRECVYKMGDFTQNVKFHMLQIYAFLGVKLVRS